MLKKITNPLSKFLDKHLKKNREYIRSLTYPRMSSPWGNVDITGTKENVDCKFTAPFDGLLQVIIRNNKENYMNYFGIDAPKGYDGCPRVNYMSPINNWLIVTHRVKKGVEYRYKISSITPNNSKVENTITLIPFND